MSPPQIDSWYFGVRCHGCGRALVPFVDISDGQGSISFAGPGQMRMKCPDTRCNREDNYLPSEIRRFRVTEVS